MSSCGNNISINKTFIIEPLELTGGSPTLSACTTMYTNLIESCSGDTSIQLGTGLILFSGNSQFSNITASTIEATTYLSGGTNILDIINSNDRFVTGGTFNNLTDSIQLTRNDGVNVIITGLTDFYTTGASFYNNIVYFDRNDELSAYTVDLSTLVVTDTYLTGATYDKNTGILELTRNDDVVIFASGITDYYVTAGTYNTLTESIDFSGNNQLSTFSVDVSALIDDTNTYITGFTYDNKNNLTITRNDNISFSVNISIVTGLTVNGDITVTGTSKLNSVTANTISNVDYIDFDITANPTHNEGRIHWLDDTKTIEVDTEVNNFMLELGHQSVIRVNNQTGSILTIGSVVYINGAQGNRPTVTLADYSTESSSSRTIGIVATNINNSSNGYVVTNGILRNVNTSSFNVGDSLYLYSGGTMTNVPPIQPKHSVRLGKVVISNLTTGVIYVSIQNGYELDELHDVLISGITNSDIIQWDSNLNLWINTNTPSFTSVSATTFYGDGSNLTGIDNFYTTASTLLNNVLYFDRNDTLSAFTVDLSSLVDDTNYYVTGGTINYNLGEILLNRNDNVTVTITGLTDFYTTGATLIGSALYFDRNDILSAYTVDLSTFTTDNFYTTGVTVYGAIAYFDRNDTLSAYTLDYSSLFNSKFDKSGGTITGSISAITISANTFYGDGSNLTGIDNFYTTAATLLNNIIYFDRNDTLSAFTVDLTSIAPTGNTDTYTTGATLVGNIAYFDTNVSLSAYTLDLSTIAPSGGTGDDKYTTGVTINGTTLYFDRTDTLSAYTADLSSITVSGSSTDTIRVNGVRNRANNNNIFLRYEDATPYNVLPYRVYQDSVITNVVASCGSLDTWDAHILTGTTIATDSIYFLSLVSQKVKYDNSVNINISSGTTLYLYMSGSSVDYPSIDVYIRKL